MSDALAGLLSTFARERFPAILGEIQQAAGFAVPVEVAWSTLALDLVQKEVDGEPAAEDVETPLSRLERCLRDRPFAPLAEALSTICQDPRGTPALRERLVRIEVLGTETGKGLYHFEDGVLIVDYDMTQTSSCDEVNKIAAALLEVL